MLQFVLASGSLKDLARISQVSYPIIRVRVDRMIDHLRQVVTGEQPGPMQLLADLVERAEITPLVAQLLREVYHSEKSS